MSILSLFIEPFPKKKKKKQKPSVLKQSEIIFFCTKCNASFQPLSRKLIISHLLQISKFFLFFIYFQHFLNIIFSGRTLKGFTNKRFASSGSHSSSHGSQQKATGPNEWVPVDEHHSGKK